jgi:hypothetical protein
VASKAAFTAEVPEPPEFQVYLRKEAYNLTEAVDSASTWANIPTALLRAELSRRREAQEKPACGSRGGKGGYNTPLHVFALILILLLSTLGRRAPETFGYITCGHF